MKTLPDIVLKQFTPEQRRLIKKHGTVSQFGVSCYECVPGMISLEEADRAIQEYRLEFDKAGRKP